MIRLLNIKNKMKKKEHTAKINYFTVFQPRFSTKKITERQMERERDTHTHTQTKSDRE